MVLRGEREKIVVSAPGKAILFGEHSVLYGSKALACAINLRTTASLERLPDDAAPAGLLEVCMLGKRVSLSLSADDVVDERDSWECSLGAISLLARTILCPLRRFPRLLLTITSEIPLGAGLGSSAAFSVAVAGVFCLYAHERLDRSLVEAHAMMAERLFHGSPSGLDHYTAIHGGFVTREDGLGTLRVLPNLQPFSLVIVDTGMVRSTASMLVRFREAVETSETGRRALTVLCDQVNAGIACVCHNVLDALPAIIAESQTQLRALNVSLPELDALISMLAEEYGLPFKISGAGGGGCLISFPAPPSLATNLAQLERKVRDILSTAMIFIATPAMEGVKIEQ